MDTITRIGLDLAKNVFEVHAVNAQEQVVLHRSLRRNQLVKNGSPNCRPAWSAWKPVAARTIGRAN